jgi:polysaccharide biosynthesis transport protein
MNALVESWQILKRRWLPALIALGAVMGAAGLYNFSQQPVYEAKGQISSEDQKQSTDSESTIFKKIPAQWIQSLPAAKKVVVALQLSRKPEQVLENIIVQKTNDPNLLEVGYRDTDPQRAAQVTQKLMEDYLIYDLELHRQAAVSEQAELSKQLSVMNSEVKLAEAGLQKFQQDFKITDLRNEKKALTSAISILQTEIEQANIQLTKLGSKLQELRKVFGQNSLTTLRAAISQPQLITPQILLTLQGIEEKLALEKSKSTKDNQVVKDLQSQRDGFWKQVQKESEQSLVTSSQFQSQMLQWKKSGISEKLKSDLVQTTAQQDVIEKRIALLNSSIKKGQNQIALFSPSENKMRLLEKNIQEAQDKYNKIAVQLKSLQTDSSQALPVTKIVKVATPPSQAISPTGRISPLWMILTGLSLGGAIAWILERADQRLKNAAAVRKIAQYPILGHIPNFSQWTKTKNSSLLTSNDDQPEHEPYRTLQSNLDFLENQENTQVIVISSSVPQEGKSTIAAHLALASSQNGQRVLLVDADLYHPQQHELWQVSNSIGLSNILLNGNQFPESIIEISENLGLLPAGLPHNNPSALFGSTTMAQIFNQWFSLYDLVVIDSTPLNQFNEAITLSKMADGIILVANPNLLESADLKNAQDLLKPSQQKILGIVINGVENYEYYKLILAAPARNQDGESSSAVAVDKIETDIVE